MLIMFEQKAVMLSKQKMKSVQTPLYFWFFLLATICCLPIKGQINDCIIAGIICDDGRLSYTPSGPGIDDFLSEHNSNGCLQEGETQSAWYYFEFMPNMPQNSIVEIVITPALGNDVDFDFSIFGPNLSCDSLGSPIRCSYASSNCSNCPSTGLGRGAIDFTEGANGDGFLAPLTVQPGQGYYILINNWRNAPVEFELEWSGNASSFLNCNADPTCPISINLPNDIITCVNPDPIEVNTIIENTEGNVVYQWSSSPNEAMSFLSNDKIPNPSINIPNGYTGIIEYTLAVADNKCTANNHFSIDISEQFTEEIFQPYIFCENTPTVLAVKPGYDSYLWSTGATSPSISVKEPGIYGITISTNGGCISTDTIHLNNPLPAANPPEIRGDTVLCIDASISMRVVTGYSSYLWSHGTRNPGTLVNEPGFYSVTVTNEFGCPASDTIEVIKVDEVAEEVSLGPNKEICFNEVLDLDPGGGFLAYEWSNKSTDRILTVGSAGLYCLTVTDINGCISNGCILVDEIEIDSLTIEGFPGFCKEGTTLTVGSTFDSYQWSNGSTEQQIFVDQPGFYSVTISDRECKDTAQVQVVQGVAVSPKIEGPRAICSGEPAMLTAETGYSSYVWSDGTEGREIIIDQPGVYKLNVTDPEGCPGQSVITITENIIQPPIILGPDSICVNDSSVLSLTETYDSYVWSNGSKDSILTVFQAGNYAVTVTDSSGCRSNTFHYIRPLDELNLKIEGPDVFCEGNLVTLSVEDQYENYIWSTGETTNEIKVSNEGEYSLTATNSYGCSFSDIYYLNKFSVPNPEIVGNQYLCKGDTLELRAGDETFDYNWSTGDDNPSIFVYDAGVFVVEVVNSDGCSDKAVITVTVVDPPTPIIQGPAKVDQVDSARLWLNAPFDSIEWSNGLSDSLITISESGQYSVTVTNEFGCTESDTHEIYFIRSTSIPIEGDSVSCEGNTIVLEIPGDYESYLWSTGLNTPSIAVSKSGFYSVTATDSEGKQYLGNKNIEFVPNPVASLDAPEILCPNATGTILSTGTYSAINWSTGASNADNITISEPGTYSVTVTNDFGCTTEEEAIISGYTPPEFEILSSNDLACRFNSTDLYLFPGLNNSDYGFAWNLEGNVFDVLSNTDTLRTSQSGKYFLYLTDKISGCQSIDSILVTQRENVPVADAGNAPAISCLQSEVILGGTATSIGPNIIYEWEGLDGQVLNDSTSISIQVDEPGWYKLTVIDTIENCLDTSEVMVIHDTEKPLIDLGENQLLACSNSSLVLMGTWEHANSVSFQWSNLETQTVLSTEPDLMVTEPGLYEWQVTNNTNGCSQLDTIEVSNAPEIKDVILDVSHPSCLGDENGTIQVINIEGGNAPYSITLNGILSNEGASFNSLKSGNYEIKVIDIHNCSYSKSVDLLEGSNLAVILGSDQQINVGETIRLSPVTNASPEELEDWGWRGGDALNCIDCWNQLITPTNTNSYLFYATDIYGCTAQDSVEISVALPRDFFVPNAVSPNHDGLNDLFMVQSNGDVILIELLQIFDRWGNQVFSIKDGLPNDPKYAWHASNLRTNYATGVFIYQMRLQFADGVSKDFVGDFTIIK